MDLYPDVLAAHGRLSASGALYRALERLTRLQFRGASLVLALGPRMRARVLPYLASETRLDWVPLWGTVSSQTVDPAAAAAWRARRGWAPDECVLLYSGNMGLGHRLGEFLSAASELGGRGPLWAFAGGGRRRSEVEAFMAAQPSARVQLLPYVAQEDVAASLSAADVHLVSLRSAWQGLIVPSKLQAAFTLGRPVIFVGPRENEAADWVLASGGGWVVAEDDVGGLSQGRWRRPSIQPSARAAVSWPGLSHDSILTATRTRQGSRSCWKVVLAIEYGPTNPRTHQTSLKRKTDSCATIVWGKKRAYGSPHTTAARVLLRSRILYPLDIEGDSKSVL